jgi:hypothetical protein
MEQPDNEKRPLEVGITNFLVPGYPHPLHPRLSYDQNSRVLVKFSIDHLEYYPF